MSTAGTEPIFTLDLGSTAVRCLAASGEEGGDHVVVHVAASVPSRGTHRGRIVDEEAVAESAENAILQVERSHGSRITSLVVALGGKGLESLAAQGYLPIYPGGRGVRREDVLQVVNHSRQMALPAGRTQLQAIPRTYRIDSQEGVRRPLGMSASRLEVSTHIVTAPEADARALERVMSAMGREIDQVVASPIAGAWSTFEESDAERGCVVVDIGAGTTDVAVVHAGSVAFIACIPVGSGHITSDLAALLKTTSEEAERLKLRHGAALARLAKDGESVSVHQKDAASERPMQRRVLCELIEARVREIGRLVAERVESSGFAGRLAGDVLVVGAGSGLPGLDMALGEALGMTARKGSARAIGPVSRQAKEPGFEVAVGLARFALESMEDELTPASGIENWKSRLRSIFGGKQTTP